MQMYKGYNILNKSVNRDNLSSMLKVLSRAKDTMVNPRMMHFISEIVETLSSSRVSLFKPSKKNLKVKLMQEIVSVSLSGNKSRRRLQKRSTFRKGRFPRSRLSTASSPVGKTLHILTRI